MTRSLNHQRFLASQTDDIPSYAQYEANPDKASEEALALRNEVETLYKNVSQNPKNIEFIDNDLFENVIDDVYEESIGDLLAECWTNRSSMDQYFIDIEAAFRVKAINLALQPIPLASEATRNAAAKYHDVCKTHLRHAADKVQWLKVIDERLPIRVPLPCHKYIHHLTAYLSSQASFIVQVNYIL